MQPPAHSPQVDLIFCRDCLVHLSYANVHKALDNFRASGSRYLLMTHFTGLAENHDIADGDWHALNFTLARFSLPAPIRLIVEICIDGDGAYKDNSLGLWKL